MAPRLKERYQFEVLPALLEQFSYKNVMQAPRLQKVVLNIGLGEATSNANSLERASGDRASIAGQHPVVTRAKRSIAQFRVRAGMAVGLMVTLRSDRMWEFLDKLMNAALPRIRDFRGVPNAAFDGRGNYNLGLREQILFPEIEYDKVDKLRGLEITIVTTANSDEEAKRLLELMGMPFAK